MIATSTTDAPAKKGISIHVERTYPHPRANVWRALTEPALIAQWLMRPEGFAPVTGTKFKLISKPVPGWRGWVECEVTDVSEGRVLSYSWVGDEGKPPLHVTFTLTDVDGGTKLTLDHVGFEGAMGWLDARLMMGPGWKKMFAKRLPVVLASL